MAGGWGEPGSGRTCEALWPESQRGGGLSQWWDREGGPGILLGLFGSRNDRTLGGRKEQEAKVRLPPRIWPFGLCKLGGC